jgi:hypothetical protein
MWLFHGDAPVACLGRWVPVRWRSPGLAALLVLASLGPALAAGAAEPPAGTDSKKSYAQEYYHSFKDNTELPVAFQLFGPDAERCVRLEPAGLRITLPTGYPGGRPSTGVIANYPVEGDCEITAGFEILKEPQTADSGTQTRFTLAVPLNKPQFNMASFSWKVSAKGGPQFLTWLTLWNESTGKNQARADPFPLTAKTGRLRFVRNGSTLAYWVSEGDDPKFTFLQEYPLGTEDLKDIRLVGSTGGPKAALDVRVTDLRIRADSLPYLPSDPGTGTRKSWWEGSLTLGIGLALLTGASAFWLYRRERRRLNQEPAGRDTMQAGG